MSCIFTSDYVMCRLSVHSFPVAFSLCVTVQSVHKDKSQKNKVLFLRHLRHIRHKSMVYCRKWRHLSRLAKGNYNANL
nr:MAG TPA: hypothetical protein [Caudoviricetes sp.]